MTDSQAHALRAAARGFGVELDQDGLSRIGHFVSILSLWNRRLRLTGETDPGRVVNRHVADCLAPIPLLPAAGPVVDLGSGAGFPGIIIACVRPALGVVLIEPRRRWVSFLHEVTRAVPLPRVEVLEARAESAALRPGEGGRAVLARGLRLDQFLALAAPLMAADGYAVAMQTPRTARGAGSTARSIGFDLTRTVDYRLPDGSPRSLLVFSRTVSVP